MNRFGNDFVHKIIVLETDSRFTWIALHALSPAVVRRWRAHRPVRRIFVSNHWSSPRNLSLSVFCHLRSAIKKKQLNSLRHFLPSCLVLWLPHLFVTPPTHPLSRFLRSPLVPAVDSVLLYYKVNFFRPNPNFFKDSFVETSLWTSKNRTTVFVKLGAESLFSVDLTWFEPRSKRVKKRGSINQLGNILRSAVDPMCSDKRCTGSIFIRDITVSSWERECAK